MVLKGSIIFSVDRFDPITHPFQKKFYFEVSKTPFDVEPFKISLKSSKKELASKEEASSFYIHFFIPLAVLFVSHRNSI